MEALILQLIKELEEVTQESIDYNPRFFGTPAFCSLLTERLQDVLKEGEKTYIKI